MAASDAGAVATDFHRRKQVALATSADSEVRRAMRLLDLNNIDASRAAWNNQMVGIVAKYYKVSQIQAVKYLDVYWTIERPGGAGTIIAPSLDITATVGVLDASGPQGLKQRIRNGRTPRVAFTEVSTDVQREMRKMILAGGRNTVRETGKADRRAVGYRRVSDGDPCTFCGMLVSRGPAYTSEARALAKGNGDPYHKGCGCTVEIIYADWLPTPAEQQYVDAYFTAAEQATAAGEPRTPQTVLYRMRADGDFKDSPARRAVAAK